jgi:diketogulonate reductase-like aldo/keto reductase
MVTANAVKAVPSLVYGTAWKKNETRALVHQALVSGFRGIDTAAQPKHYQEHLVGDGIRDALGQGKLTREDLYIQTKFTSIHGQDPKNMPYDASLSVTEQVDVSVKSSLHNLRHSSQEGDEDDGSAYIDCLVLHSPFPSMTETREAWAAMESHVPTSVRTLGVSNVYQLPVLRQIYDSATIKPVVLQNRFYRDSGYDGDIRVFCRENGITYQSFWTLTANPRLLKSEVVGRVAEKVDVSRPVALYGLVLGLGKMSVLNGTTNAQRMRKDLDGVQAIRSWRQTNPVEWQEICTTFEALLV